MHILLIHQAFTLINEPGGTRHHELALQLADRGHRISVVTSPVSYLTGQATHEQKTNDEDTRVQILRSAGELGPQRTFIGRTMAFFQFMLSSFWLGMKVRGVDAVWGTSPPLFQAFSAWLLARMKQARFVLEVRDLWPEFAIAVGVLTNPWLIWLSKNLEKFLYRRADAVIVNSPGYVDHVSGLGAKNIRLIPNGVDVNMFHSDDDGREFRQRNNLNDFFVVLYAGAHGISNDLGVLLDAADRLRGEKEIRIVLIGDGRDKANLERIALRQDLHNTLFLPAIPKKDMPFALAGADLCLAILKPIEAFKLTYPNKVFDYMAAGKPVLLAIEGVIRELVKDARAGIFVPPGDPEALADAIVGASYDREGLRRLGANGQAYVRAHFDRRTQVDDLLQAFGENG